MQKCQKVFNIKAQVHKCTSGKSSESTVNSYLFAVCYLGVWCISNR